MADIDVTRLDFPTAPEDRATRYVNVADRLTTIARRMPTAVAVACPGRGDVAGKNSYRTCTFEELDRDATALALGLIDRGVTSGTRLVLLVRPGVEFVKLVFALLRSGATAVLIDPGMGKKHLIACLSHIDPQGFVAISPAQAMRKILRNRFPRATLNVTVGRRWFWSGPSYDELLDAGKLAGARLPETTATDPAAIIFTSGSTGPPKGVLYTHQMFETQVMEIQREYDLQPGGSDLACFALFGLFNSALGITTVFPRMDFSRPATAAPRNLLAAANDWQVTQAFASPTVWDNLSRYCQAHEERIPTLRKVFSCGAPVPASVLRRMLAWVDTYAEMFTPYGATESLPVATIAASEVFADTEERTNTGAGVCVGRKFASVEWRVIRITDEPINTITDAEGLPPGEIGELIVRGPQVSPRYTSSERNNALAKIVDGSTVWHRMGDVGYLDEQGRFWYCGRKNHRVDTAHGTLFSVPCESIFNTHNDVARSALVGVGPQDCQNPLIIIEPTKSMQARCGKNWSHAQYKALRGILLQLAAQHDVTRPIQSLLFHRSLPTDVRHNAKINREALAHWAAKQVCNWPRRKCKDPYMIHTSR